MVCVRSDKARSPDWQVQLERRSSRWCTLSSRIRTSPGANLSSAAVLSVSHTTARTLRPLLTLSDIHFLQTAAGLTRSGAAGAKQLNEPIPVDQLNATTMLTATLTPVALTPLSISSCKSISTAEH